MEYYPNPINTATVTLTTDLVVLIELLAKNAHDNWAKQRMSEGGSRGPTRNDTEEKHPGPVPYEQLPESEKEYNRKFAMETIKTIQAIISQIPEP